MTDPENLEEDFATLFAASTQTKRLQTGKPVDGKAELADNDRQWVFKPDGPWQQGDYKIIVNSTIEDLAGNNVGKLFEVDVFIDVQKQLTTDRVTLTLKIP